MVDDPDVAILKRVSVSLKLDHAGRSLRVFTGTAGLTRDLQLVVNHDAIVPNRHDRVFDFLPFGVGHGVGEVHIVGLPGQWWEAHIDERFRLGVDAATFVVLSFESERIENLDLVVIDLIESAVPTALTACGGFERKHEFDVHRVVVELVFGPNVFSIGVQQLGCFVETPAIEGITVSSIKKNLGTFRRLRPYRLAFARGFGETECGAFRVFSGEGIAGDRAGVRLMTFRREIGGSGKFIWRSRDVFSISLGRFEDRDIAFQRSVEQAAIRLIPTCARQPTGIENRLESTTAQRDDLRAELFARVFSLDGEIRRKGFVGRIRPESGLGVSKGCNRETGKTDEHDEGVFHSHEDS